MPRVVAASLFAGALAGLPLGRGIRMRNPRAYLYLVALTLLPGCASSRGGLAPGDHVRITRPDADDVVGFYQRQQADSLVVVSQSNTLAVSRSQIATLERQEGTVSRRDVVGTVGLVVGGAIALATLKEHEPRICDGDDWDLNCARADALEAASNVTGNIARVAVGLVAGAVVGALVGSAFRTENWIVVPLIDVAPTGQSSSESAVDFGLRFAHFGRPW